MDSSLCGKLSTGCTEVVQNLCAMQKLCGCGKTSKLSQKLYSAGLLFSGGLLYTLFGFSVNNVYVTVAVNKFD